MPHDDTGITGAPATAGSAPGSPPPDRRPTRRWRSRPTGVRQVARDITLVVLGAALALGVDEWREGRERGRRVELALASIRGELHENRRIVEVARGRHVRMRDTLLTYVMRGVAPPLALCQRGVFSPGLPLSTAWQTARETGTVTDMPYATVLALGQVYEQQARYRALGDAITQAINVDYQREGLDAYLRARCGNFVVLEEDFANREGVLAEAYEAALRHLEPSH